MRRNLSVKSEFLPNSSYRLALVDGWMMMMEVVFEYFTLIQMNKGGGGVASGCTQPPPTSTCFEIVKTSEKMSKNPFS